MHTIAPVLIAAADAPPDRLKRIAALGDRAAIADFVRSMKAATREGA